MEQFQRRAERIREIRLKADDNAATPEEIAELFRLSGSADNAEWYSNLSRKIS